MSRFRLTMKYFTNVTVLEDHVKIFTLLKRDSYSILFIVDKILMIFRTSQLKRRCFRFSPGRRISSTEPSTCQMMNAADRGSMRSSQSSTFILPELGEEVLDLTQDQTKGWPYNLETHIYIYMFWFFVVIYAYYDTEHDFFH